MSQSTTIPALPLNFLSPVNFQLVLARAPNVEFFTQKLNIPGLSLPEIQVSNPLIRIPYPGDHLMYEEFYLTFKVDENLQNYMEIYKWLKALGKQDFISYSNLINNPAYTNAGIYSDISIQILTSKNNPNYEVILRNAIPVSLGSLEFDATEQNLEFVTTSARFVYAYYDINKTK